MAEVHLKFSHEKQLHVYALKERDFSFHHQRLLLLTTEQFREKNLKDQDGIPGLGFSPEGFEFQLMMAREAAKQTGWNSAISNKTYVFPIIEKDGPSLGFFWKTDEDTQEKQKILVVSSVPLSWLE